LDLFWQNISLSVSESDSLSVSESDLVLFNSFWWCIPLKELSLLKYDSLLTDKFDLFSLDLFWQNISLLVSESDSLSVSESDSVLFNSFWWCISLKELSLLKYDSLLTDKFDLFSLDLFRQNISLSVSESDSL